MLERKKRRERGGKTLAVVLSVTAVISVFLNGEGIGRAFSKAAVAGAIIGMPQGIHSLLNDKKETLTKSEIGFYQPVQTGQVLPESQSTVITRDDGEFETPEDVLNMQRDYSKEYPASSKDGDIEEITYSSKNANMKYKNVSVKNTTSFSPDLESELKKRADLEITDKSKPSVLIYHTHTTESYEMADNDWYTKDYATRSKNEKRNMVRVGDEIQKQLENAGFNVIHDTTVHDLRYNGAYSRSRETVERILSENPTIQVTIDVHRDAIYQQNGTRIRPVCTVDGKKCAQVMIITGCEDGDVEDFPDWRKNLTFALLLQKTAETKHEGLMRPVMFCNRKYNMDVTPCSLLLEFGSDSNTLEQAMYAGSLVGDSLAELLEEYVKK